MKKVITYGTFDLFHEGHYRLLQRARELGDYLIVGVTTEQFDRARGKLNVEDSLITRIENVKNTGFADEIIVEDHLGQKEEDIQKYGISIFTLGSDWEGTFDYLKQYCQVIYLERTKNISSSILRQSKRPVVRVGVVGTGRIAFRFVPETRYVSGVITSSAYNPHEENVRQFAEHFSLDAYSGDYEEFLESVDAVYIASPHETHYKYAKTALEHGRHVLCEKPMSFCAAQVRELFTLARQKGLVLMEAIKTAYCPGFEKLIEVARSGIIGEIKDVEACFTRLTSPGVRESVDTSYGGGFTEFGSHTMLPIFKLLGTDYREVVFYSLPAPNGVDAYTKAVFRFDNALGTSKSGIGVKSEGQLVIAGTKGYLLAKSPWWLTREFEVRYEDPNIIDTYKTEFYGDGLRYEINEFVIAIIGKKTESEGFGLKESVAMASVMEKFLQIRDRTQDGRLKINGEDI